MKVNRLAVNIMAALALLPAAAFCGASALGQSIALNRLITPNGDKKNDTFIFRCHNPRDSGIEAKIYDLSGREVATMTMKQRSNGINLGITRDDISGVYFDLEWNPNSGGHHPGGVYIYQVRLETKVYKGTIAVIR
ncbi:MAG: gliding motility-associated C-terminal domain-containing protein [Elusimicrobiota bacterium]